MGRLCIKLSMLREPSEMKKNLDMSYQFAGNGAYSTPVTFTERVRPRARFTYEQIRVTVRTRGKYRISNSAEVYSLDAPYGETPFASKSISGLHDHPCTVGILEHVNLNSWSPRIRVVGCTIVLRRRW
jgi:hypothetical protein